MQLAEQTEASTQAPPEVRKHRMWIKKYMPEEVHRVLRDYDTGMNAEAIFAKHGVSKATLYRWIAQYEKDQVGENSPAWMRTRIASLEKAVIYLSEKLVAQEGQDGAH